MNQLFDTFNGCSVFEIQRLHILKFELSTSGVKGYVYEKEHKKEKVGNRKKERRTMIFFYSIVVNGFAVTCSVPVFLHVFCC